MRAMRACGALLACAVFWGGVPARAAPTDPAAPAVLRLSEAGAAAAAASSSPRVSAARAALSSAEAEHDIAARARLPDVLLSGRYTRLSSMPGRYRTISFPTPDGGSEAVVLPQLLDGYAVRAALTVPLSDAWLGLAAASRAAGDAELARVLELDATRARVAYEARAAFLELRRAWAARKIARTSLDVANQLADGQAERVRAGTAPPSSQLTFDAARSDAAARGRSADVAVSAAEAALKVFLPRDASTLALEPDDVPDVPHDAGGRPPSHPELRALAAEVHGAEERRSAETLSMLPKLSFTAGADVTAPSPRAFALSRLVGVPAWDVSVQLEWSMSSLTTGVARRARASAERDALSARLDETRRQIGALGARAEAARQGALGRIALYEAAVRTAERLRDARRAELEAGVATPLEVVFAEGERVKAELEKVNAELDLRFANAELDFVAGWFPGSAAEGR